MMKVSITTPSLSIDTLPTNQRSSTKNFSTLHSSMEKTCTRLFCVILAIVVVYVVAVAAFVASAAAITASFFVANPTSHVSLIAEVVTLIASATIIILMRQ